MHPLQAEIHLAFYHEGVQAEVVQMPFPLRLLRNQSSRCALKSLVVVASEAFFWFLPVADSPVETLKLLCHKMDPQYMTCEELSLERS